MSLRPFLQKRGVAYELVTHPEAFDAQHLAHAVHTAGREVAKTVLLRANHGYRYFVAVLPATSKIDFHALDTFLGGLNLSLATEHEIAERCPDCDFGALPPFGTQYGAETIVDKSLTEGEYITFQGESRTEAIRMKYSDFYDVERPLVASFACPAA